MNLFTELIYRNLIIPFQCQRSSDCCSRTCLSFSYKCINNVNTPFNRPPSHSSSASFGNNVFEVGHPIPSPDNAITIEELVNRFGAGQEDNTLSTNSVLPAVTNTPRPQTSISSGTGTTLVQIPVALQPPVVQSGPQCIGNGGQVKNWFDAIIGSRPQLIDLRRQIKRDRFSPVGFALWGDQRFWAPGIPHLTRNSCYCHIALFHNSHHLCCAWIYLGLLSFQCQSSNQCCTGLCVQLSSNNQFCAERVQQTTGATTTLPTSSGPTAIFTIQSSDCLPIGGKVSGDGDLTVSLKSPFINNNSGNPFSATLTPNAVVHAVTCSFTSAWHEWEEGDPCNREPSAVTISNCI